MRLVFVNWAFETHGSAVDIYNYARTARSFGHDVILYGRPNPESAFPYSLDIGPRDAVVFIFEFTTRFDYGEKAGLLRMLGHVPRRRRVVLDCDGKYNEAISVNGDCNHADDGASRQWREVCESLSDKIFQPTLHPVQPKARPFFFHAYNPAWEQPLDFRQKDFGMMYVGNNWFRWRPLRRVLEAIAPVRHRVGRIGLVGHGWDAGDAWGGPPPAEDAYYVDPAYLRSLAVEVAPPVRFDQVVEAMGRGVFSPVIYRPLFDHLRMVTCRTFETPAAAALPLFGQEAEYVKEIWGEAALELRLPQERPEDKIVDFLERPEYYAGIVRDIRCHMARRYSYEVQFRRLLEIIES
jgi:hypothetical protein